MISTLHRQWQEYARAIDSANNRQLSKVITQADIDLRQIRYLKNGIIGPKTMSNKKFKRLSEIKQLIDNTKEEAIDLLLSNQQTLWLE